MFDGQGSQVSVMTIVLSAILGLAIWLVFWRKQAVHRHLPPGPPSIPILGSLPFIGLMDNKDVHVNLSRLGQQYGDIFHFWAGNTLVVVMNSYSLIRQSLVNNAVVMAGRPKGQIPNYNIHELGIIDPTYTAKWIQDRNLSLAILKDFGFGKTLMEDRIVEEVDAMLNHLNELTDIDLDPAHAMQVSFSNVICSIVLGQSFKHDDQRLLDMIGNMDIHFDTYMEIADSEFIPILRLLPSVRRAISRFVRCSDTILDFHRQFIKEHKEVHVKGDGSDFIHAYLDRAEDTEDDESLLFLVRDLVFAASETTSASLRWAFVYMANYPDVQRKVQEELDSVLLKDRLPRLRDKVNLPYTEAVIQELQRMSAVAPQVMPHETLDDVTIDGYLIPKGTMILANLWAVLRDPTFWPEPEKFKPERFLNEDGTILHRPELIPFSLGRRSCLGEIMARQEIFLFFTAILHTYSIHRPDGVDQIDESGKTMITRVPRKHNIVIRKRRCKYDE